MISFGKRSARKIHCLYIDLKSVYCDAMIKWFFCAGEFNTLIFISLWSHLRYIKTWQMRHILKMHVIIKIINKETDIKQTNN